MMKKLVLLLTISLTVFIMLVIAKPIFLHYHLTPKPFNSSIWLSKGSDIGEFNHRQLMVDDLIKNILPGKKWNHIEIMLGTPLSKLSFPKKKPDQIYHLGKKRQFLFLKSQWLLIYYDQDGFFTKAEIVNT